MSKNKLPLLSIIIPVFNSKRHFERCLSSLLNINYKNFEIILVDDGSTDGSLEKITRMSEKDQRMRVIKTLKRKGIPSSRNLGIEVSRGELIAFLDIDMEVSKSWPGPLLKVLMGKKDVGGAVPLALDFHKRKLIQAAGLYLIPFGVWVVPSKFGEVYGGKLESREAMIGGVGSIVKRGAIEKIRGFDSELGMFDDLDLGWRLNLFGWKTFFVPESVVYHWTSKPWSIRPTTSKKIEPEFYLNNLIRAMIKNLEVESLILFLPQALLVNVVRATNHGLRGNFVSLHGLAKAWLWNIMNIGKTLEERRYIQSNRKFSDEQLYDRVFVRGNLLTVYPRHIRRMQNISKIWKSL